jgi:hypothetical protein
MCCGRSGSAMSGKCSLHLFWSELACHDQIMTPYPLDWRSDRGARLGQAFEALRSEVCAVMGMDTPLLVSEGYRTEAYQTMLRQNPRYKAAVHSQHCEGRAIDVYLPRGLAYAEFVDCLTRAAYYENSPIRYIEIRPAWMGYLHFDTRLTKKLLVEEVA